MLDLERTPDLLADLHVRVLPSLLLLRDRRVERRVDGDEQAAVDDLLWAASAYLDGSAASATAAGEAEQSELVEQSSASRLAAPGAAVAAADELLRRLLFESGDGTDAAKAAASAAKAAATSHGAAALETASNLYRAALASPQQHFAFRARLGLVRCAELAASGDGLPPQDKRQLVAAALEELQEHHRQELYFPDCEDAAPVSRFVTHVELLVDRWNCTDTTNEHQREVLELYADERLKDAFDKCLRWYQLEAGGDIQSLVAAYCAPPRRFSDRAGDLMPDSIYAEPGLAKDITQADGPTASRSLMRRLLFAVDPLACMSWAGEGEADEKELPQLPSLAAKVNFHSRFFGTNQAGIDDDDLPRIAAWVLGELEFLLDRKRWVMFHPRMVTTPKGGAPMLGRGTGSGDGYSRPYMVAYQFNRMYPNSRKMDGPHTNRYEGWDRMLY